MKKEVDFCISNAMGVQFESLVLMLLGVRIKWRPDVNMVTTSMCQHIKRHLLGLQNM